MADRSRRARRQISDATDEDSEGSDSGSAEEFDPRRLDSMRRAGRPTTTPISPSRVKRVSNGTTSASIQRSTAGPSDDRRQSIKLTVKAPPSKLREVMRANEVDSLQDVLGGGRVLDGPRSRRTAAPLARTSERAPRPKYAEYGESDIEDEEDEDDDVEEDEDAEGDDDEEADDFSKVGAEPEGDTDNEDDMEEAPPHPQPKLHAPPKPPKITFKTARSDTQQTPTPKLVVTQPQVGKLKSVEDQEMEDDPGDEEEGGSSDLSEDEDEEETKLIEADAEAGIEPMDEDGAGEGDDLEDDEEGDSDSDETPGSGAATPDLTKLTKRQRGRPEEQGTLLALDMAPQQRKFFTDAEKAMKKDEHARKRKELTKRKIDEEKTAALNRLLKPQASKARGAAPKPETLAAAAAAAETEEEVYYEKANPLYTRWISTKDGVKLGVPEEWLGKRVGKYFGPPLKPTGMLIQEIEMTG